MASNTRSRIWITWEHHRRSVEIADKIGAELRLLSSKWPRPFKYLPLIIGTVPTLVRSRNSIVFCQNPSIILATLVVMARRIFRLTVVVDRHSNFKLHTLDARGWRWRVFHFLSRYTVANAHLTIVTNRFLAELVTEWGGRAFVLADPVPEFSDVDTKRNSVGPVNLASGMPRITWISTYSSDEPFEEVLSAIESLGGHLELVITSDPPEWVVSRVQASSAKDMVTLAGFLPRNDYIRLLKKSDIVMVLTTLEHCLTCGAYEATGLGKPMILSDTQAIRSHFKRGAIYVDPDRKSIAEGISAALQQRERLAVESDSLKRQLRIGWEQRHLELEAMLGLLRP